MRIITAAIALAAVLSGGSITPAGRAIEAARSAIEKNPSNPDLHAKLAMALARRARETSSHAYYEDALKAADQSLKLKPDNFEGLKARCWILLGQHEFGKALDLANRLNRRMPDDVTVYGMLSDAHVNLGNYKEAEQAAQWMLDIGRSSVPGLTRAAHLRELFGDIEGALELMNTAFARLDASESEDRAWIAVQTGHLLWLSGKNAQAAETLKHALDLMPDYHYALAGLARVRASEGAIDEAVKLFRKRYEAAPHPENLFDLASALHSSGSKEEAAALFAKFEEEALEESEGWDNANRELVFYYTDYVNDAQKALRIASAEYSRRRDIDTLDAYAWALHKTGDHLNARRQIESALATGSAEPRLLYHAGAIAAAQRDIAAARRFLKRVPEFAEDGERAAELLESFGSAAWLPVHHESIVIRAKAIEPSVDRRDEEVFKQTLFSRDDHIFHLLGAGINAGQHEGGGKSVELRRFGFNLDHGGVGGGLKVLVDNVGQNQTTQGHGQGYLGSLKSLTPELVQDVDIVNGPFQAEYGDFSGLGVVHVRLRDSMPDEWTARLQGGSYDTQRGFLAFSPAWQRHDLLLAYEGSHSDGPFLRGLDYRRDNITGSLGWFHGQRNRVALRWNAGRNRFVSSGQIPLDEVAAGRLDRFGSVDGGGGEVTNGSTALHFKRDYRDGAILKANVFVSRSLFDLFSNFTFFLQSPESGDRIQQHDSRLQQGGDLQYVRVHRSGRATLTGGANLHGNQVNVSLSTLPAALVRTRAHANVMNTAGYVQEDTTWWHGRLRVSGGLRYDSFRYRIDDRVFGDASTAHQGAFQPKAAVALQPMQRLPLTLHWNYGRGISSMDARGLITQPKGRIRATTDFYQGGLSSAWRRVHLAASVFRIDRSNELVYVPDDGSLEFFGPSRSQGFEIKAGIDVNRKLSWNGGITKVAGAWYRNTDPRVYVDSAPHLVANSALTLSAWRGFSGSVRVRLIDSYRLDGEDASIRAAGHTVWDVAFTRRITRALDLNFSVDNLFDRRYYEMQNYFESRLPEQEPRFRIHGTPGYGRTLMAGITARFGRK